VVKNWEGDEMTGKNRFRSEEGPPKKESTINIYAWQGLFDNLIWIEIILQSTAGCERWNGRFD
jgi:hypothetical protein